MKAAWLLFAAAVVSACLAATPAVAPLPTPGLSAAPLAPARTTDATVQPSPSGAPSPTSSASAVPTPSAAPTPSPVPLVLDPPAKPGKFAMDVYRPHAHVRQATTSMCVPASMQIMINLMSAGDPDRSRETQDELYALARSYSPWISADRDGASARGWAAGLEQLGYGHFEMTSLPTMDEALRSAARQMRFTGKPAGLLVWKGDHAWVMSGFKASADPAWTDEFDVTAVWIEDPWSGRTDRTWGAGLDPHTLLATDELRDDFVSWPSRWFAPVFGAAERFVIVAPSQG